MDKILCLRNVWRINKLCLRHKYNGRAGGFPRYVGECKVRIASCVVDMSADEIYRGESRFARLFRCLGASLHCALCRRLQIGEYRAGPLRRASQILRQNYAPTFMLYIILMAT